MRMNTVAMHGYWGPLREKREKISALPRFGFRPNLPHRSLLNANGDEQT